MRNPVNIAELMEAVELAEASLAQDAGERVMERRMLEGTSRTVSRPVVPDIVDEPMPTEPLDHGA